MKNQTEITTSAIYKVTIRETGKTCYAVPSDSQIGVYYVTCFEEKSASWTCTCPAGQYGKTCKHAKAAQVSVLANKAEQTPAAPVVRGNLNGTREFSLLK